MIFNKIYLDVNEMLMGWSENYSKFINNKHKICRNYLITFKQMSLWLVTLCAEQQKWDVLHVTIIVFTTKHEKIMYFTTYSNSTQLHVSTLIYKEIQIKFYTFHNEGLY
jgi:hypothetical protein